MLPPYSPDLNLDDCVWHVGSYCLRGSIFIAAANPATTLYFEELRIAMMLVRTYVAPSLIDGLGVFAGEPIKKGQAVWQFETELSVVVEPELWSTLPLHVLDFLNKYAFRHPEKPDCLVVEADDGRFMNHSDTPNVDLSSRLHGTALRDIAIDEEMTCNYAYLPGWRSSLGSVAGKRQPARDMPDTPSTPRSTSETGNNGQTETSDPEFEVQASELCRSCGICCLGVVCDVAIVSCRTDREFVHKFADIIIPTVDHDTGEIELPCPLFDGCCSQYAIRPCDCRTFQCALLNKLHAQKTTVEQCRKIVDQMLAALTGLTTRYNSLNGKSLSREEIFPVIAGLLREAREANQEKQFWQSFPEYLTVCFLRRRHYLA